MTGRDDANGPLSTDRPDLPAGLKVLAAELTPADRRRVPPPPEVWDGIVAALDLGSAALSNRSDVSERPEGRDRRRPRSESADDDPPRLFTDTVELRSAVQQSPKLPPAGRIPLRTWLPVAAALLIAIAGAIITVALNDEPDERILAVATLTNDGLEVESDKSAAARLIEIDGAVMLEVSVAGLDDEMATVDGYLELWLTDAELDRVLPLGVLAPGQRYRVPDDLALGEFPVVDVSVEQPDGDPGHSGRSIWRGPLESAVDLTDG